MRTRLIESAPALSLALTAVSCWVVGIAHAATYRTLVTGDEDAALRSVSPLDGVWFAAGILGILGAHELGHWWAARRHRVAVSPPLFIPGPTFAGTFGAFMRLRGRPRTRRCAFDIAAAGPLAGFATLLLVLWAGVALSAPAPLEAMETARAIGHPALLQAAVTLIHGPVGDGSRDRAAPAGDGSLDRNAADQPEPVPRRPARRRAYRPRPSAARVGAQRGTGRRHGNGAAQHRVHDLDRMDAGNQRHDVHELERDALERASRRHRRRPPDRRRGLAATLALCFTPVPLGPVR